MDILKKYKNKKGFTQTLENCIARVFCLKSIPYLGPRDIWLWIKRLRSRKKTMQFFSAGFTIIELLIVIAVISLLSSVIFASLNSARVKARDAKRVADKRQVILALNLYYSQNGDWPQSANSGTNWSCLAPSAETCWNGNYSGLDSLVSGMQTHLASFPISNADNGNLAHNRLLYISNFPGGGGLGGGSGPAGAYIIWFQENSLTNFGCTVAPKFDKYYYCYEYLGQ